MVPWQTSAIARLGRRRRISVAPRWSMRAPRAIALGVAVTLAIDAYVHATSAAFYDPPHAGFLTEGNLFRVETALSALLALLVLIRPARWSLAAALVVAATAVGAVVLYRYVNVGAIGPLPNLYEPSWQVPGKLASAFAEGIAVVLCAAGLALIRVRPHGTRPSRSAKAGSPHASTRRGSRSASSTSSYAPPRACRTH